MLERVFHISLSPSSVRNAILTHALITYSKLLQWLAPHQSPFADFHLASIHRQNPWLGARYTLQGYFDQKLPPIFSEEKTKKLLTFGIADILEEIFILKNNYYSKVYTSVFKNNQDLQGFQMILRCIFIIAELINTLH